MNESSKTKNSHIILVSIIAVIILLIVGIGAGILIGTRMASSSSSSADTSTAQSSVSSADKPKSSSSSSSRVSDDMWYGKDIRKSGTGVYPGMDKDRACTQAGVEAAYWLISGTGNERKEELYKRFFLPNLVDKVDASSTAHWINHDNPPFTGMPVNITTDMLGTKVDDNKVGCLVSYDGKNHGTEDLPNASHPEPTSGTIYFELNRKDENSPWYVLSTNYAPEDYQRNIKQQGNN